MTDRELLRWIRREILRGRQDRLATIVARIDEQLEINPEPDWFEDLYDEGGRKMSSDNLALARAKFLARAKAQRRGNAPPQESRQEKHVAQNVRKEKKEKKEKKQRERRSRHQPQPAIPPHLKPLSELAREFNLTIKQLYAAVTRGTLRITRLGFFMYATDEDVQDYLRLTRENLVRTAKAAAAARKEKAAKRPSSPRRSLSAEGAQGAPDRRRSSPTQQGGQDD